MAADHGYVGMPHSQRRHIERRGFARQIAPDFEPGVLEDDGVQRGSALDDSVELRRARALRDPQLHAHHGTIAYAAVEFAQAEVQVIGIEIDEAECAVMPVAERLQHLIVLGAQGLGRRIVVERIAHVRAQPVDAHAIGQAHHLSHLFVGRAAVEAAQVAMQIPDHDWSHDKTRKRIAAAPRLGHSTLTRVSHPP